MKLSTIWGLGLFDYYIFCRAWFLMCRIRLSLSLFNYERTLKRYEIPTATNQVTDLQQLMIGIGIAERRFFKNNCLTVSIAVKRLLASYGYGCSLHMGAGVDANNDLHAHAWLQYEGMIVVGYYDGIEKLKEFL